MPGRLDRELVRRGFARSREHAAQLVRDGSVLVDGAPAAKPSFPVSDATTLEVTAPVLDYVSRGALKLVGALDALPDVDVFDRVCLDAGASTGGFTDVLLRRGARLIHALDVGTSQLHPSLRDHPQVQWRDKVNVRYVTPGELDPAPDLVVADLSFISLTLVIGALARVATPGADFVLMVKPQFEVGKGRLGAHGVVHDPESREGAVQSVLAAARDAGLFPLAVCPSLLPGPAGNREYFVWLRATAPAGRAFPPAAEISASLHAAVRAPLPAGPLGGES